MTNGGVSNKILNIIYIENEHKMSKKSVNTSFQRKIRVWEIFFVPDIFFCFDFLFTFLKN